MTRLYFYRFGLRFGNDETREPDHSFIHFRIRKVGATRVPDARYKVSKTTATENLKQLLYSEGLEFEGVTDKSAKMEGVTRTLVNGASLQEVQHQGRWQALSTPLYYKHNSSQYKTEIAAKVPYD